MGVRPERGPVKRDSPTLSSFRESWPVMTGYDWLPGAGCEALSRYRYEGPARYRYEGPARRQNVSPKSRYPCVMGSGIPEMDLSGQSGWDAGCLAASPTSDPALLPIQPYFRSSPTFDPALLSIQPYFRSRSMPLSSQSRASISSSARSRGTDPFLG